MGKELTTEDAIEKITISVSNIIADEAGTPELSKALANRPLSDETREQLTDILDKMTMEDKTAFLAALETGQVDTELSLDAITKSFAGMDTARIAPEALFNASETCSKRYQELSKKEKRTPEENEELKHNLWKLGECLKIMSAPEMDTLLDGQELILSFVTNHSQTALLLKGQYLRIAPFIQAEIDKRQSKDTVLTILNYPNYNLPNPNKDILDTAKNARNKYLFAVKAIRRRLKRAEIVISSIDSNTPVPTSLEQRNHELTRYTKHPYAQIAIDRLQEVFFITAPEPKTNVNGQRSFIPVYYESQNSNEEITLLYDYEFDDDTFKEYGLQKKFDAEDYFIQTTIANLFMTGNTQVSPNKIYKELNGKEPNSTQLENLFLRLIKGMSTIFRYDNSELVKAWNKTNNGTQETYGEIWSPVLPIRIANKRLIANGKLAKTNIVIDGCPPIAGIGLSINQKTTVPKALFYNNIPHTDRYWRVLQYTIKRIARLKHGDKKPDKIQKSGKILYADLFEKTKEKTTNGKKAAKGIFHELLNHFVNVGYISNFKEEQTKSTGEYGVRIYFKNAGDELEINSQDQIKPPEE